MADVDIKAVFIPLKLKLEFHRLIKRRGEFVYLAISENLPKEKQEIECSKEVLEGLYATWQKLADYEDTGLTAKEIIDLQEQNKYLLEKLEKYEWKYCPLCGRGIKPRKELVANNPKIIRK